MVLTGNMSELMNRKLAEIRREFREEFYGRYQCGFRYGILDVMGKDNDMSLEEILRNAEEIMNEQFKKESERVSETGGV